MEDITDADDAYAQTACKYLEKNHDLHVQSDTLLLVGVFQNFIKMCLEIYELDSAKRLSAPQLAWQAALGNTEVKFDLILILTCY